MKSTTVLSLAAACIACLPAPSIAADSGDLKALREEIRRLRDTYEKRIEALEKRVADTESTAAQAQSSATGAASTAAQAATSAETAQSAATRALSSASAAGVAASARQTSESAFNPALSLILSGTYTSLKADPATRPYAINGFIPSNGEVAPPPRSFSLGESELAISANVDHYFRGALFLALPPEQGQSPAVEEAYVQTLGLPGGVSLKFGRFLSGIGYMNEQHPHVWDFADAPLAYKAFFGGQQRGDGVQLKWLAPTELFLEFGVEAGRGGSFPSADRNKNGFQTGSLFAHVGGDIGIESSWRAGLSMVASNPRDRAFTDTDSTGAATLNRFSGSSRTWIADAVWKWAPGGNSTQRYLKLQGEYFRRNESGSLATNSAAGLCGGACADTYGSVQSGGYAQAVYKFAPAWRAGLRHDRMNSGNTNIALVGSGTLAGGDFPVLAAHRPRRDSLMLDWSPSEFSLVRMQYARDHSRIGAADDQVWLQYIMSLGAHGAHKY